MKIAFKLSRAYNSCSKEDIYSFWHSFTNCSWWLLSIFKYSSFSKGYHVSAKGITYIRTDGNPLWFFTLWRRKRQRVRQTSSAIIYDSFHLNKALGHIPLYWSKLANKFLKFPNHHISVAITGKKVKRDIGLGLEIPLDYFFMETI